MDLKIILGAVAAGLARIRG